MRYITVMEYLKRYIADHHLEAGDRLPTEKELADDLGVSRITVRRAYQELMDSGYIQRIQGSGTFYTGKPETPDHADKVHVPLVLVDNRSSYPTLEMIRGADQYLGRHGCYLSVHFSQSDSAQERQTIRRLVDGGARCLMVYPCTASENSAFYYDLILSGVRIIFLDRLPREITADLVTSDNFRGGYLAARHLLEAGCTRPCLLSTDPLDRAEALVLRQNGFLFALGSDARLFTDPQALLRELTQGETPPDGLFFLNDAAALRVLPLLEEAGIAVPRQLALVSFDDLPFAAELPTPLTEVSQSFFRLGYEGARLAYHAITDPTELITRKILPVALHIRDSSRRSQ